MKRWILFVFFALLLSACNGWVVQPLPYDQPTPLQVTSQPVIYSPTPIIIGVTNASATPFIPTATITRTFPPTNTNMPPATPTYTPTTTSAPTNTVNVPNIQIIILGCNTSIDITHGMGEVTNAFVTLKNIGGVDLTNLKATLYGLDEGRVHPNKTFDMTALPVGYQVTIKLTVDSTFKKETPIQVEVTSDQGIFPRAGSSACKDIGVLAPNPDGLKTPVPNQ